MDPLRLRKLSGGQFAQQLADYTESLRADIEAQVAGFAPDKAASRRRVERARNDYRFFHETYFPHYRTVEGEAALHTWLLDNLPAQIDRKRGTRTAVAAPRGNAKSTIGALTFPLWCVLTGRKRFPLIVSDTAPQAQLLLAAVKAELEANPRLARDYPDACGAGPRWRDDEIVTRNGVMIVARGARQKVRGLRHGPQRPDLVIGDDLENDVQVKSLEQRKALKSWWRAAVRYVGPPDGSLDAIVVGTVLHFDSLLAALLASSGWTSIKFRAIEVWPDDMSLWDEFADLYNAEGEDAARAFYEARRKDMDAGSVVCWPQMQPLVELMIERAESPGEFATEKQNDPSAGPNAIFSSSIHFWSDRPLKLAMYGAVDPSMGKAGKGRDPSAILVGGIDPTNPRDRTLFVVEAPIRKRTPERIIDEVIAMQARWSVLCWAVEAVAFQEYFRTELVRKSALEGVPVPAVPVTPSTDKGLRIESMQPHMANRLILLHPSQQTLVEQFRYYPDVDHDDGPDALEMLFNLAMRRSRGKPADGIRSASRPDAPPIPWSGY